MNQNKVKCPYDEQYYLNVKIVTPGQAEVYEQNNTLVFNVSWDSEKYPTAIRASKSDSDSRSGFRITPHKVRYFSEKLLDTFKVALELIRQGYIK